MSHPSSIIHPSPSTEVGERGGHQLGEGEPLDMRSQGPPAQENPENRPENCLEHQMNPPEKGGEPASVRPHFGLHEPSQNEMVGGLGNQNRSGEIANFQTEVPQKQPILVSGSYAAASSSWEVDRRAGSPKW